VGDGYILSRFVIDFDARGFGQRIWDVLDERSGAEDVEALQAVADAKHGLAFLVGVSEQLVVDGIAARVGGGSVRRTRSLEPGGIDIGVAARQEHTVAALDHHRDFRGSLIERDADRLAAG
jgi:hypothetical protein